MSEASLIDILQAIATFCLGASSVYLTRRHYQEKQSKENIEEIIAPLYFEVEKIREALQLNDFSETGFLRDHNAKWRLMENTSMEIRARNVDARISGFYNSLNSLRNMFIDLSAHFRPQIDELFENEVSRIKTTSFHFRYETGYETDNRVSPHRYFLFGLNPIEFMKKDEVFEISKCKIIIWSDSKEIGVNYGDIESECETFFAAVEEKLESDPKIAHARAERKNLIKLSTEIFDDLGKMIA